jgi:hypothetical protein
VAQVVSTVFFLSSFLGATIPRLTWLILPVVGVTLIGPALKYHCGWRELIRPSPVWTIIFILGIYLLINVTWAANQLFAMGSVALFWGLSLLSCASIRSIDYLSFGLLRRAAISFAMGAALGTVYLLFDLLTHASLMRWLLNTVELLQRNPKHMNIINGEVIRIKSSVLNHNAAVVMFNFWPALACLTSAYSKSRPLSVGLFALTAITIFLSEHDSSKVALALSSLVFLCAIFWPRFTVKGLAVTWCLAFVLVLPTVLAAYKVDLQKAEWLPSSFRQRVVIWQYTAEAIPAHLWGGIGVASTPALKPTPDAAKIDSSGFRRTTGEHSHDLFLQTWYELGGVGVLLVAVAGASIALIIYSMPSIARPFASAAFFACLAVEAFAWSIWQTWLMCAICLLVLYLHVSIALFRKQFKCNEQVI